MDHTRLSLPTSLFGVSCFHILTIVNSVAMSISMQTSFLNKVFWFLGWMPGSRIAESHGSPILSFWRSVHIVFQKRSNLFMFPSEGMRAPFILHSPNNTSYFFSLWCAPVLLMWDGILFWFAFLWWEVISNILFFIQRLTIWMPALRTFLFISSHFLIEFFFTVYDGEKILATPCHIVTALKNLRDSED